MKRSLLAALLLLPLCACGGLGSARLAPDAAFREAESDATQLPAAPFVAGPNDRLYVANAGNNSITVYHIGASGNAVPLATIAGSNTQLNNPGQLSEDTSGNLYVANLGSSTSSILVFAHGATGNVAPTGILAGPQTGFFSNPLYAATVDTTGKIFAFAAEPGENNGASEFLRFAPDALGNQAPVATSACCQYSAWQLVSDSTGKNIVEASAGQCCSSVSAGVYTFKKQFPNGGTPAEPYAIGNFGTWGVADDPTTKTYLVSGADGVVAGIFRFAEDTVGNGAYAGGTPSYTPAVVSVITSDTCGSQLALGYERNIYVVHSTHKDRCATDAVYVYEHDASGNATPLRILTGSATKLDQPTGIYEGK